MQALYYKEVLGNILCQPCSTKKYWDVLCANFVVQSSTGKYFVVQSSTGKYSVQAL